MLMLPASDSAPRAEREAKRQRRWFALPRERKRVPRIGEILVRRGLITRRVLAEALLAQPASGLKIGELLVKRGALCQADLDSALREQKFRRVLVLVMALSGAFPSGLVGSMLRTTSAAATAVGTGQIGTIVEGRGVTIIASDGSSRSADAGSSLNYGERIKTSAQGSAKVMLRDQTLLTIEGNAIVVADNFICDSAPDTAKQARTQVVGGLRALGGLLSRQREGQAFMATIGIRG